MTNADYYLNLEFTSKSNNNVSIKKVVINTKMLIKTLKFKVRKEYLFFFFIIKLAFTNHPIQYKIYSYHNCVRIYNYLLTNNYIFLVKLL